MPSDRARKVGQAAFLVIAVGWLLLGSVCSFYHPSNDSVRNRYPHQKQDDVAYKNDDIWGHSDPGVTLITTLLVIVGAVQIAVFLRQLKLIRESLEPAKAAAQAAQDSAVAAREAFEKRERPYVFIFGVQNVEPGPNKDIDGALPYIIANHGQAPAIIDRIEYCLSPGTEPGAMGMALDDHPLVVSPVLGINIQVPAKAQSVKWLDSGFRFPDKSAIPEIKIRGTTWFFWIKVFYHGPFSEGHETSGCWIYDVEPGMFIRYGGDEYNYTK